LEEVMRLVQEDLQVVNNIDNLMRWTALHYASRNGHVEVACYLLDHVADVHTTDLYGNTALTSACWKGHLVVVELLVSRGANPAFRNITTGLTPLVAAVDRGHVAVVEYLLGFKAVRATPSVDGKLREGVTALWVAVFLNRVHLVKMLVEIGADPMIAKPMKVGYRLPMEVARRNGHHECIELLQVSVVVVVVVVAVVVVLALH